MTSNRATSASIDSLVYDFFISASDAILQDRRAITNPIHSGDTQYRDNADFCRHRLQPWQKDLSKTLVLDLYIFDPKMNKHILMERWKFHYQRNTEMKESRLFNMISRRVLTLIRSLYCFVRMMPGYNLINISAKAPTLSFQLYEQKSTYPTSFIHDISHYSFNPVSTSKGSIIVSVRFITSQSVKEILTNINGGGGVPSSGHSRRNSRTEENGSTAAIPIPSSSTPVEPASKGSGPSSLDATDHSYSSTGSQGATGGMPLPGSTPPLGSGARSSRPSSSANRESRDVHRRSFHLPPHAEHGGHINNSNHTNGDVYQPPVGQGQGQTPPQTHSQHPHQQATSLDSYSSANSHQLMQRYAQEGRGADGLHRDRAGEGVNNTSFPVPIAGPGPKFNSAGAGGGGGPAPSTSYGNSFSQQSTPPFLLGEITSRQSERYSAGSFPPPEQLTQDSSTPSGLLLPPYPPYPAFSTSLTSTSPHLTGNNMMMALIEQRRGLPHAQTQSNNHNYGYNNNGNDNNNADEHGGFVYGSKTGHISPSSMIDFSDFKLNIAPLPPSPFDTSDPNNALVPSHGASRHASLERMSSDRSMHSLYNPSHNQSHSLLARSFALQPALPGDNTLDAIRLQQSQRTRRDSADASDMAYYTDNGGGSRGARQLSGEKERSSTTSRGSGSFDLPGPDEDMFFAFADADMMLGPGRSGAGGLGGSMARVAPLPDSLGVPLLHSTFGGRPHGIGANAGGGAGAEAGAEMDVYAQLGGAGWPDTSNINNNNNNNNNIPLTAEGLSGELMSKLEEFKNLSSSMRY